METTTLRPGLLVSLNTTVTGNVSYVKRSILDEHIVEGGAEKAKWETERTIQDPFEFEQASAVRGKCRTLISAVCAKSAFGYLCPEDNKAELDKAIAEARKIADEFNSTARLNRVRVSVLTGRVAADDVEAIKAINSEIKDLMTDMAAGIEKVDVEAVRKAATRAKDVGQMLTGEAKARVQIAVEAARNAATKLKAAGENAVKEIDQRAIRSIKEARVAFLDLSDDDAVAAPAPVARVLETETVEG